MARGGVFAVSRGIWDDPDFAQEPFTQREGFLWLVSEAAWRHTRVRVGSAVIELQRGQCAFSTRFIAKRWKWSEPKVRRFLTRLKESQIIDAQADARGTRITICKYDRYQRVGLPIDVPEASKAKQDRRTSDAAATRERRKEETRNQGNIEDQAAAQATYVPARVNGGPGSDAELWAWLGPIVGERSLALDLDLTPIRELLKDPLISRADIETGIREACERSRYTLHSWSSLVPWIRRVAPSRLAATQPRGSPSSRGSTPNRGVRNPHLVAFEEFTQEVL